MGGIRLLLLSTWTTIKRIWWKSKVIKTIIQLLFRWQESEMSSSLYFYHAKCQTISVKLVMASPSQV